MEDRAHIRERSDDEFDFEQTLEAFVAAFARDLARRDHEQAEPGKPDDPCRIAPSEDEQ